MNHGAYGELGPIVAMAVLLGVRGPVASLIVLAVFALIAVARRRARGPAPARGRRVLAVVRRGAETTGQTPVRLTVLLLVSLGAVAAAFELDVVLGAFAAGFILRRLLPAGHEHLEHQARRPRLRVADPDLLRHLGDGHRPAAVVDEPVALVAFVLLILPGPRGCRCTCRPAATGTGRTDRLFGTRTGRDGAVRDDRAADHRRA